MSGNVTESIQFANVATTQGPFTLRGGKYLFVVTGSVTAAQVQALSLDGATYIGCGTALAAPGTSVLDLAPGTYQVSLTGTAAYIMLTSVPY